MANILDKAIAAISPEKGYRRAVARAALSVMNNGTGYGNYGASRISRAMRSWHVGGGSAKEDIEDNLDILRKRSRDAYMGIPLATGAIKTLRTNVVGSGLVPTPQVDADYLHLNEEQADRLQAQISREFELWADSTLCDAAGMDLLYGDISERSWWEDAATPKRFADDLAALGDVKEITVYINSGGGDVFAAQAIGNMLERNAATVTAHIDGLCASAATIL